MITRFVTSAAHEHTLFIPNMKNSCIGEEENQELQQGF
jgi:hypothetical protein